MTMILALVAALLIQDPGIEPRWPHPDEYTTYVAPPAVVVLAPAWPAWAGAAREDLAFMRAVEESVAAGVGWGLPGWLAGPAGRMTSPRWAEREAASAGLLAAVLADPGAARFLVWTRRHPDPETRVRCNGILRRLSPCPQCGGKGKLGDPYEWDCPECDTLGTAWPWSI